MPSKRGKIDLRRQGCAVPGSDHIAFPLATTAQEEIGNSSMIFIDAIGHKAVGGDEETKTPFKRIDDHERKNSDRCPKPLAACRRK